MATNPNTGSLLHGLSQKDVSATTTILLGGKQDRTRKLIIRENIGECRNGKTTY